MSFNEKTPLLLPVATVNTPSTDGTKPQVVYLYAGETIHTSNSAYITRALLRVAIVLSLFFVFFTMDFHYLIHGDHQTIIVQPEPGAPASTPMTTAQKPVLEAHIMSKCPDARDCLEQLVIPAMQQVADKVDFKLSYIATVGNDDNEISCMHGPEECLGNIIELCAAEVYPDPKMYLGFTMCMSENYKAIPQRDLVKGCALEHGMEFEKLNQCASRDAGAFGVGLLRSSAERTRDAGVQYSCTVRLNDDVRCIRDGGEWKNCPGGSSVEDLVRDINKLAA